MAFTTIFETPGLSASARRRATAAGPRAVTMRSDHHRLLGSARFVDVTEFDVTPAFRATAAAWLAEFEAHADELAPAGAARRLRAAAGRPTSHAGRHRCRAAAPRPAARPTRMSFKD
jgi:hypothetical protein